MPTCRPDTQSVHGSPLLERLSAADAIIDQGRAEMSGTFSSRAVSTTVSDFDRLRVKYRTWASQAAMTSPNVLKLPLLSAFSCGTKTSPVLMSLAAFERQEHDPGEIDERHPVHR